jgi:HemY protein
MRYALWLFFLFALAVALALFTGANPSTVSFFWPPYRLDASLNLVFLVTLVAFFVVHLAWRSVSVLLRLPTEARRWRALQKDHAMHQALLKAQSYLLAGRYTRAAASARQALDFAQELSISHRKRQEINTVKALGHLIAARSAHFLHDTPTRDQQMENALKAASQSSEAELKDGTLMQAASWALEESDASAALGHLASLNPGASRRVAALKIRLRAAQQAGQVTQALETSRLLIKHRAFTPNAAASLVRGLAQQAMQQSFDLDQLSKIWMMLDDEEKAQPLIAAFAVKRLEALGGETAVARRWLIPAWGRLFEFESNVTPDAQEAELLVAALQGQLGGLDSAWLARIEKAHTSYPQLATLHYLAGIACLERQLWGKAEILLTNATPLLKGHAFECDAWRALAALAEHRDQTELAFNYYKKAAMSQGVL